MTQYIGQNDEGDLNLETEHNLYDNPLSESVIASRNRNSTQYPVSTICRIVFKNCFRGYDYSFYEPEMTNKALKSDDIAKIFRRLWLVAPPRSFVYALLLSIDIILLISTLLLANFRIVSGVLLVLFSILSLSAYKQYHKQ